jgi:hypothetical protein
LESGGLQIAEALASGLPVIARDIGGISYTLGGAGIMVKSDKAMLKELRSLDVSAVRAKHGLLARQRAEEVNGIERKVEAEKPEPVVEVAKPVLPPRTFIVPKRDNRPRLVHALWYGTTIGGIQTMIDQEVKRLAKDFQIFVISKEQGGAYPFAGATVYNEVMSGDEMRLIEAIAPNVLVHHWPMLEYARYTKCPVVWIFHSPLVYNDPVPTWVKPCAVFANYQPNRLSPAWAALDIKPVKLGVDLEMFKPKGE